MESILGEMLWSDSTQQRFWDILSLFVSTTVYIFYLNRKWTWSKQVSCHTKHCCTLTEEKMLCFTFLCLVYWFELGSSRVSTYFLFIFVFSTFFLHSVFEHQNGTLNKNAAWLSTKIYYSVVELFYNNTSTVFSQPTFIVNI